MELRVETGSAAGYAVVTPLGEVDLSNVGRLRDVLNELYVHRGTDVVIDMDQISFIDSAGLGALIGARRRACAVNGSLTLVCNQERILRVFAITRLDRVFDIVESHPAVEDR